MESPKPEAKDSFNFWKTITLFIAFFAITPIAIGTSLFSLVILDNTEVTQKVIAEVPTAVIETPSSGARVFASLPSAFPTISGEVIIEDARPEIIRQYLAFYNSPLEPFSYVIVEAADENELDYRLTTAISQQESNLCKIIPPGTFNCWGWGIHSEGTLGFDSYAEAVKVVSKGLKENYIDKGLTTPEEIMAKYTPLSNGSWAYGVEKFMAELE